MNCHNRKQRQGETAVPTFTIDNKNNIVAHAEVSAAGDNVKNPTCRLCEETVSHRDETVLL
jgi:hypothetical protein